MNARILVIIPAYNEANNICSVINEILAQEMNLKIVVVNDGSSDNTSQLLKEMRITEIPLPVNAGMFCAVQTGFKYALRNDFDIAIQIDADGQHDPSGIPQLIKPLIDNSVDVVIGSRFLGNVEYSMPWSRLLGTKIFGWITSILAGKKITDTTCGFRAYSKAAIKLYAMENSFEFRDSIGLVVLSRGGYSIEEVPTIVRSRMSGNSTIKIGSTLIYPFKYFLSLLIVLIRNPIRKR